MESQCSNFKAGPIPVTTEKPNIVPRTTKAAALRAGVLIEKTATAGPRTPMSKERQAQTFTNVPGHKRNRTIVIASTAAPSSITPLFVLAWHHSPFL